MPSFLILDIETVPNEIHPLWVEKTKEKGKDPEKEFPYVIAHKPCCIGYIILNLKEGHYKIMDLGTISEPLDGNEKDVLDTFNGIIGRGDSAYPKHDIVTWNGRGFDLPCLAYRNMRYGLRMPWYYGDKNTRYRFSDQGHFDLKDYVSDHGSVHTGTLDWFAKLIGLPGKTGTDGSQVSDLYDKGKHEEIASYCMEDVFQTAFLLCRTQLLRGDWNLELYTKTISGMIKIVQKGAESTDSKIISDACRVLVEHSDFEQLLCEK